MRSGYPVPFDCAIRILTSINIVPMKANKLRASPRQIQPRMPAPRGPKAQYSPVVSDEVYFCATGCSVNPKQLQTRASRIIAIHDIGSDGKCEASKMKDEIADKLPIVPS